MSQNSRPEPATTREFLVLLHDGIRGIQSRLDRMDTATGTETLEEDQAIILLQSILSAIQDQGASLEVLHQRMDSIARYVPAAARIVSGER